MRATLIEVLGEERAVEMYSLEWLRERVPFHLDGKFCTGAVLWAEDSSHAYMGHTIVRVEAEESDQAAFGLFSTIYVEPHARRHGLARAMIERGEAWMRQHSLKRFATNTGAHNEKLIRLFESSGYAIVLREGEMVQLARASHPDTSKTG